MIGQGSTVLVTGGSGFIGSHLVKKLVASGARVTVVDNLSTGRLDHLEEVADDIDLVVGDVADVLRWNRVGIADFEYAFHLAANPYVPPSVENPELDFELNLHNSLILLEALRAAPNGTRLVNVSSAAVYGNPVHLPIRETDLAIPISPYGVSKLAAERYVDVYCRLYDVRATSLRFFSVYGPLQRKQVVYDLLRKLREQPDRLTVLGNGMQSRDFTYVEDIVQAMLLAANAAPGKGEVYNVASGTTHRISDLVSTLCEVCGVEPEIVYTGRVRPGDAEEWVVDLDRILQLGFKPSTDLATGLAAVRDWYDNSHG
jgi:UDP-glucose 4-epimerase